MTTRTKLDRIKGRNAAHGGHFFDYDAIRFFNSFVYDEVIRNTMFVTSEQFDDDSPRLFTIRRAVKGGETIETVGKFQQFETYDEAKAAASLLQSCAECGIDLWDGEAIWLNQEAATYNYPGSGGDPYCEEHTVGKPVMYRSTF